VLSKWEYQKWLKEQEMAELERLQAERDADIEIANLPESEWSQEKEWEIRKKWLDRYGLSSQ
jgi:hypothetical protein